MTFTRSTPSPASETVIMTTRCFSSGNNSMNISRCSFLFQFYWDSRRTHLRLGRRQMELVIEAVRCRSEGRRYFHGSVELKIPRRVLSLGHMNIRFDASAFNRSEEHTSELQSLRHLVCRLLL